MPVAPSRSAAAAATALFFLCALACGGGGGNDHRNLGQPLAEIGGHWVSATIVDNDACAIATTLGVSSPAVLTVTQTGATLLVGQLPAQSGIPAFAGIGAVAGYVITVTYDYEYDVDLGGSGICKLGVHRVEAGTLSGDKITGVLDIAVRYDGDNVLACSHFDGCSIHGTFIATLCPSAGCA